MIEPPRVRSQYDLYLGRGLGVLLLNILERDDSREHVGGTSQAEAGVRSAIEVMIPTDKLV